MHPTTTKYLKDDVGLHMWARLHFSSRQYDMQTINIAESMNSLLRHVRSLPIIALTDYIRSLIQRWFYEYRLLAAARYRYLITLAYAKVDELTELSQTMTVYLVSHFEFEVKDRDNSDIIDVREKKYNYRYFKI